MILTSLPLRISCSRKLFYMILCLFYFYCFFYFLWIVAFKGASSLHCNFFSLFYLIFPVLRRENTLWNEFVYFVWVDFLIFFLIRISFLFLNDFFFYILSFHLRHFNHIFAFAYFIILCTGFLLLVNRQLLYNVE